MLLLCYICPPLAVLLMGRPFSAFLNLILTTIFFWIPGIKHALSCYADYKLQQQHSNLVDAVNYPAWFSMAVQARARETQINALHQAGYAPQSFDELPHVGAKGTVFRRR